MSTLQFPKWFKPTPQGVAPTPPSSGIKKGILSQPIVRALLLSLAAHGLFAVWLQTNHLIDTQTLDPSNQTALSQTVLSAVLLAPAPNKVLRKHSAPSTQPPPAAQAPATPRAPQSQPQEAPKADQTTPPQPQTDTIVLPHEELARPLEPLPPASAASKESTNQFSLPNTIELRYEGAWGGTPVKGTLNFQLKEEAYTASLVFTANILFKTIELAQSARGILNEQGLDPRQAEDKTANGRVTAITVEPLQNRIIISSKEGFLPYTAGGKDLLSLILQLSVLSQAQPAWQSKGTAQDFTVYRPSGIKRWRYQSQGFEKVQIGAQVTNALYIKRVPQNAEPDYEYIHHFWLDTARHGMPLRIKLEDAKSGRVIDLTLVQWNES